LIAPTRPVIQMLRPKQWAKNLLVFAAPAAAGALAVPQVAAKSVVVFLAFCSISSGTYALNDTLDAPADAAHPTKRNRPVAAGKLSPATAWIAGSLLIVAPIAAMRLAGWRSVAAAGSAYAATTLVYSLWAKHVPALDVGFVASGFAIRAIAGGLAAEVPLSNWFLIVVSFGALFVVTEKRLAEANALDRNSAGASAAAEPPALTALPTAVLAGDSPDSSTRNVAPEGSLESRPEGHFPASSGAEILPGRATRKPGSNTSTIQRPVQRPVLGLYSADHLSFARTMAAAVTALAYCLWAFERAQHLPPGAKPYSAVLLQLSIAPFVIALQRYAFAASQDQGEEPEEIFFRDRALQALGAIWLFLIGLALYVGKAAV
jgi:decaprenyl-phosphate phosphoribosyltransferase